MSDATSEAPPLGGGRPAVVLLSGGLDSATCLALALDEGWAPIGLSFRYGQRHDVEVDAARRIAERAGIEHLVCQIDLRAFGGSALTSDLAVPKHDHVDELDAEEIPVTYVPARNTIFLSFALALAEVRGAADVFIGVNALDYSGYPDCRPEFVAAFEAMAGLATRAGVEGTDQAAHPHPAHRAHQGRDHPHRCGAGGGARPHRELLRPQPRRPGLWPLRLVPAAGQGLPRRRDGRPHPVPDRQLTRADRADRGAGAGLGAQATSGPVRSMVSPVPEDEPPDGAAGSSPGAPPSAPSGGGGTSRACTSAQACSAAASSWRANSRACASAATAGAAADASSRSCTAATVGIPSWSSSRRSVASSSATR